MPDICEELVDTTATLGRGRLRPPFKIHGGKYYLSGWVRDHFPEGHTRMNRTEAFCGAWSVGLNADPVEEGFEETISDLNLGAIQIWRALRDEPKEFIKRVSAVTYAKENFLAELERQGGGYKDYMDHAVSEFIVRRMSRGGLKNAFAWSDRQRGGQPGEVNAWQTMVSQLPLIAARAARLNIFHRDALEVIAATDGPDTFHYVDPPYDPSTRTVEQAYEYELDLEAHEKLLVLLKRCRGKILLSGYNSALYERLLEGWKRDTVEVPNHSGQSAKKQMRSECLWWNW